MKNISKRKSWKSSPSFALISVLSLVSLAALTATAFLASARLERQATSSIGNATRLEMALDSGKICASQVIGDNTQPDVGNTHVILYWRTNWTDELGYPFIGQIKASNTASWYYFPLFSPAGLTNLDTNVYQTAMRCTNTHQGTFSIEMQSNMATKYTNTFVANPGLNHPTCVQIPLLGGRTSPPVGWVYLHQEKRKLGSTPLTNTSPVVRIAWFTEDLEGLIDADRMGASTTRSTGTNSEEISPTNATDTNGSKIITSISTFTNARKAFISYGLLSSPNVSGILNSTNARYFASGLRSWAPTNPASPTTGALEWIPVGIPISGTSNAPLGYTNQGYTKLNINTLVTSSGSDPVGTIASAITNNLPSFRARSGAMNSNAYISNIAANIVDYVDTDTNPTIDSSTGIPNWRGVEAIAWPNEVFTRIHLSNRVTKAPNYEFEVIVKHYIEVWNLSSTNVAVNGSDYSISNNLDIALKVGNWYGNLKSADPLKGPITEICTNVFTLPPNSYGVMSAPSRNLKFNVPTALAPGTNVGLTIHGTTPNTSNKYTIFYKSKIIDAIPAGRVTPNSTNLLVTQSCVFANAVNLGISDNLGSSYNLAAGDPRGGLFIQKPAMDLNLNETTPGGRNSHTTSSGGAKIVDPKVNWPDGGHSANSDTVPAPTSTTPPQGLQKQGNINHWVQKINNNGKMTNIMELGNIFDPIQWGNPINPFHPLDTAAWMELNATATNFDGACGRNSLRIGRAEHQRFAFTNMYGNSVPPIPNMGMSAAALLDLFCLNNGTSPSGGSYSLGGGKINLNTAPAPVLRALAGGIILTNDVAQLPASASVPSGMAEAFAQGVMRFRSKYPFLTPSHLAFIGTDPSWPNTNNWPANAVFGNTNTITLSSAPGNTFGSSAKLNVTEWNDQATEEWFSKIFALSSYQSHNFRIYVVAQLVATNSSGQTNAIGPVARKYYQIYARNTNNSGIAVTPYTGYQNNTIYTWTPAINTVDIYKSTY